MEMNEIEFVNGRRVLPAGFDVEKAERAIDFFFSMRLHPERTLHSAHWRGDT